MRTLADVVVGDKVIVREHRTTYEAEVIKAGRVWLDLRHGATWPTWRVRRDTGRDGSGFSDRATAYTSEEWESLLTRQRAESDLRAAGIEFRMGFRWTDDAKVVALAEAVKAILG